MDCKISVAMIVQDDGKNVRRALDSCDFADEIIIIDGGSQDDTLKQISKYMSDGKVPVTFLNNDWPGDFSIQRNASFKHCEGDWIVRLDSDEQFGNKFRNVLRPLLGEVPEDVLSIRIRQCNLINNDNEYAANLGGWETHPRIFRSKLNGERLPLLWNGRVHEWVSGVSHRCLDWNACVIHYGWIDRDKLKEKEQRYINIPGSGFDTEGSLTDRYYVIRDLPEGVI